MGPRRPRGDHRALPWCSCRECGPLWILVLWWIERSRWRPIGRSGSCGGIRLMTNEERGQAVIDYGFTERQARFLVLVMRHAGLCVKRQYAAFAGIANGGEKCNAFFDKLVSRGFAVATACIHNRARLYHVHHKPLYQPIGEPDSRHPPA